VKLLLDTHVWIWSQEDPERLGPQTKRLLLDAAHENHVCTISTLELARLVATDAIAVSIALREWVERALHALHARTISVSHEIAMEAYALPVPFHKDPADRLLIAACRCHDLTILSADERILAYSAVHSRDARR
jgi:PIN domain nuclease of toxin-antitoxin system